MSSSLFVGDGGYITCGVLGCIDPSAADRRLGTLELDFALWRVALTADATLMRNPVDRWIARRRLRRQLRELYELDAKLSGGEQ